MSRASEYLCKGSKGSLEKKVLGPLPVLYLADLPEGAAVANIRQAMFPIVGAMVPSNRLADVDGTFPRRSELCMTQVTHAVIYIML